MPTIRMASSTYGSQSVSKPEANMSRRPSSKFTNRASRRPVFCMSFRSDFFSISPNRRASRARLLLVTRLDGHVRGHLRDDPVAVALARLFGNLAGTHSFPITLCSEISFDSFLNKGQLCYLFTKGTVNYIVILLILLILFYRCDIRDKLDRRAGQYSISVQITRTAEK